MIRQPIRERARRSVTRRTIPAVALVAALVGLAGCFDSLVGSPCREGFALVDGHCVAGAAPELDAGPTIGPDAGSDAGLDAGLDAGPDAMPEPSLPDAAVPDAPACSLDLASDPANCGACGHACASGLCAGGVCLGEVPGHVVAIGHDYSAWNHAMARVLGNAAGLAAARDVAVARWRGTGTAAASTQIAQALTSGLAAAGRTWHAAGSLDAGGPAVLVDADVVLVEPQVGDGDGREAAGMQWATALDAFLARGGVVIVLEGEHGTSTRFAAGAALFAGGAPVAVTGAALVVTTPADALAAQVLSPYAAAATSVVFPGLAPAVIAAPDGGTVVFHAARY